MRFLFQVINFSKIILWWWLHNSVKIPKPIEWYIFNGWIVWYMNYISIKLLKKLRKTGNHWPSLYSSGPMTVKIWFGFLCLLRFYRLKFFCHLCSGICLFVHSISYFLPWTSTFHILFNLNLIAIYQIDVIIIHLYFTDKEFRKAE